MIGGGVSSIQMSYLSSRTKIKGPPVRGSDLFSGWFRVQTVALTRVDVSFKSPIYAASTPAAGGKIAEKFSLSDSRSRAEYKEENPTVGGIFQEVGEGFHFQGSTFLGCIPRFCFNFRKLSHIAVTKRRRRRRRRDPPGLCISWHFLSSLILLGCRPGLAPPQEGESG